MMADTTMDAPRQLRWRCQLNPAAWLWWGVIGLIVMFLLAPIIVVVIGSFSDQAYLVFPPRGLSLRWYVQAVSSREFRDSALISLELGALATLISTIVGIMAALGITARQQPAAEVLMGLVSAPLLVPGIVVGIAMLFYFTDIGVGSTFTALVLAHTVLTLPYVVRSVLAGLETVDRAVEEAAQSLGAGRFRVITTITLPMIRGSVLAGAVFAFIISFDEVVVTLFLASPRITTLPVRIYNYIAYTSDPSIAAVSTLMIVVTTALVLVIDRYVGFARLL
ncbi:MAG: ABC transporter permease [Acidisphaera sp.]|nr:ABC transporter permease [Acidisphaera sp.]